MKIDVPWTSSASNRLSSDGHAPMIINKRFKFGYRLLGIGRTGDAVVGANVRDVDVAGDLQLSQSGELYVHDPEIKRMSAEHE